PCVPVLWLSVAPPRSVLFTLSLHDALPILTGVENLTLAQSTTEMTDMSWVQVLVLSIVQGLTEFLPVSSSGHLRIVSELFWGQDAGASFTAVIQLGTALAVVVFFANMIWQILTGWFK